MEDQQFQQRIALIRATHGIVGVILIVFALSFGSCYAAKIVEAPEEVRREALYAAETNIGVPYVYGGGDFITPRHLTGVGGVDCSGLVINCYQWAAAAYGFDLDLADATVATLYSSHTALIAEPEPGDLLFMGDSDISHVSIFKAQIGDVVVFIDAYSESGVVSERAYRIDSPKIKEYRRMLLVRRRE